MPSIHLPYINIALDAFALVIALVLASSCLSEISRKNLRGRYFFFETVGISVALIADMVAWFCEGRLALARLTVISNTLATCAGFFAIICFMGYLKANLYENSRAASIILSIFRVLCIAAMLFVIGNAFFGYTFTVSQTGHWHHTKDVAMGVLYLLFPMLAFFAVILMAVFAKSTARISRIAFVIYTLFPVAGAIIDYTVHGISLTFVGLTISALVVYTSLYIKKRKLIESQRNALMISQINPHFLYNTLTTIASMCDIAPSKAKGLTIEFSRYLRQNLSSLSKDELIPFEDELGHVECYLRIEKARFRENLNVIYSIQSSDFKVPPLSIQPLVENAIKHGVTQRAEGGTVKISSFSTDTHYVIEIIDDGVGFDTEAAEMHVGLENVKKRVAAMCHGDLHIKSTPGIGTRVTVELPKKRRRRG